MSTTAAPTWAAVNIETVDSARLGAFWAEVLHRPSVPGISAGTVVLEVPENETGIQMLFHQVEVKPVGNAGYRATLQTEAHDEEIDRITGLGATVVASEVYGPLQVTVLADPDGNPFNLVTVHAE
jgi:hypothetical protein